jgi:hypothetical protein
VALSVLEVVGEFLLDILVDVGIAKLFDGEDRIKPWIAILLSFWVTVGLVMLVFFHHWFSTGAALALGIVITV